MNTGLILMFVALAVCLLIGVPVAFSIGISCMTLLYVNGGPSMDILLQRMVSGAKSFNMLAMPMFIFAGALMVYGSTPRLIKLANMLLRKFPGGLGATAMAACGFFGAVSGSGVASAAAIGKIIGPSMLEEGYPKGLTSGLIAAGGTMACIIPPSIVMVVYAQSASVSVGDMFLGGVAPGLLTIIALIALNSFFAVRRQKKENKDPHEYTVNERMKIILDALLPLLMPVAILGGVFSGLCTATEAAVVAVVYALFLAVFVYRELTLKDFFKVSADAVVSTGVIMLIISVASPFGSEGAPDVCKLADEHHRLQVPYPRLHLPAADDPWYVHGDGLHHHPDHPHPVAHRGIGRPDSAPLRHRPADDPDGRQPDPAAVGQPVYLLPCAGHEGGRGLPRYAVRHRHGDTHGDSDLHYPRIGGIPARCSGRLIKTQLRYHCMTTPRSLFSEAGGFLRLLRCISPESMFQ